MVGKLTPITELSCSRLPAVMGMSPWSTPNDELAKTVDALNGKPEPVWSAGEAADWGNLLEPVILQEVTNRLGLDTLLIPKEPFPAPGGLALNASLDGIGCAMAGMRMVVETNPEKGIYVMGGMDRIVLDGPGVLESKCADSAPEDEPAAYRGPIQLQGCMICSGYNWGAIGVLYRGRELRIFVYPRDPDMCIRIAEVVEDFERRKRGPDWYPPVSTADAARTWSTGEEDAPPIQLQRDAVDLIDDILVAREVIKAAEATAEAAQTALMEMLGNHTEGSVVDADGTAYRVRWPMRKYKAQPEKVVPAKEAYQIRLKSLDIKVLENAAV